MIREGQIVLFRFPPADQTASKLRPALVLRRLPGPFDDWLLCMISSQVAQAVTGFDETIAPDDKDFTGSGLKVPSVIRIARLAVADRTVLRGGIGDIDPARLQRIKSKLNQWITGA